MSEQEKVYCIFQPYLDNDGTTGYDLEVICKSLDVANRTAEKMCQKACSLSGGMCKWICPHSQIIFGEREYDFYHDKKPYEKYTLFIEEMNLLCT